MSSEKQTLRQAENTVHIEGILKEKRFEATEINGKPVIRGEVDIEVRENEVHTINFFSYKYKMDSNEENEIYKGLVTVMNEYKAINEVGKEEADRVRITQGRIELNEYYGQDGTLRSFPRISSSFINRVNDLSTYNPKAEFKVEVVVKDAREEFDKEENPTGRVILDTYIPLYGGKVIPFTFVVVEDGADYVLSNYEAGQTVRIWGDVINYKEIIEHTIEAAFGKADKKVTSKTIKEFLVTGGSEPYDEDDEKAFDPKLIKKALTEREIYLEELKNKNKNKGKESGEKVAFDTKVETQNLFNSGSSIDISSDDLPF